MRIVHWYPNLLDGGAVADVVAGLAEAQAALGAEVFVAAAEPRRTREGAAAADFPRGPRLLRWEPAWRWQRGSVILRGLARADREELARLRPDVVHIHGELNPDNLRVPSIFDCAKVLSPHGAFHPVVLRRNRAAKAAYLALARRLLYRKVVFHALSPLERRDILRLLPRAEVYVAPNGPSPRMERLLSGESMGIPRPPSPSISFLFAGRLDVRGKALDTMLEAFARAARGIPGATLVLAGADPGGARAELLRLGRRLGVEAQVEVPGLLDEDALARAYGRADVYVQLSRNEAFSLSVAEALLAGVPVILGREVGIGSYPEIGSLPHVAIVGQDAASIAEAMTRAAGSIESLKRNAREGRTRVREFLSWKRVAGIALGQYRTLTRR
jgi:glycosyltransferase involved in cell wall biosynthesis